MIETSKDFTRLGLTANVKNIAEMQMIAAEDVAQDVRDAHATLALPLITEDLSSGATKNATLTMEMASAANGAKIVAQLTALAINQIEPATLRTMILNLLSLNCFTLAFA